MKAYFKILFSAVLMLTQVPQFASAQVFRTSADAAASIVSQDGFQTTFSNVVYSITTLPKVLEDMSFHKGAAENAISQTVAAEIYSRLDAGFKLLSVIMEDKSISEAKRYEMAADLSAALGEVLFKVLRLHESDAVRRGVEEAETGKKTMWDLFFGMTEILTTGGREIGFDVKNLLVPGRSQNGELVFGPFDRMMRKDLSDELIVNITKWSADVLPKLKPEPKRQGAKPNDGFWKEDYQGFWKESFAQKALRLKIKTVRDQKMAAYSYAGLAMWGLLAPHIDVVGLALGYNDNTLLVSSLLFLSVWTTAAFLKFATISTSTISHLRNLIRVLDDPAAAIEAVKKSSAEKFGATLKRLADSAAQLGQGRGGKCENLL